MSNPTINEIDPIAALLPLRSVIVTLTTLQPIEMGMLHHLPLHAWLRTLAHSPDEFSKSLVIEPLENGHHHYQAGEFYRFKLTITAQGCELLSKLMQHLQELPNSAQHIAKNNKLHANVELFSIQDAFDATPFQGVHELSLFGLQHLANQIVLLEGCQKFNLNFITPALLKKTATTEKGPERYCRNTGDFDWHTISARINDTFINLIQSHTGQRYSRNEWPLGNVSNGIAIWLEHRYGNAKTKGKTKFIGGAFSRIDAQIDCQLSRIQWAMLILGQHLGIGQSRGFGLGLYQINTSSNDLIAPPRPKAAHQLLAHALSEEHILTSLQHSQKKHGFSKEKFGQYRAEIGLMADRLLKGRYQVPSLQPVDIPKKDGDLRHLHVPPLSDRMLQRCISQWMTQLLETHWMQNSYGYRPGRSRYNARDKINQLIQQGYQWVVEADVKAFFDNIEWANIEQRLRLIFQQDPIVEAIMAWVKAPIITKEGNVLPRERGLPQGAPLSPLLANLVLDDFDADMQAYQYNIVRYADDFVLLFKSEQEANLALDRIHQSLNEHQLYLNPTKTKVTHCEKGFRFLGFFFIDGYAIETTARIESMEEFTAIPLPQVVAPSDHIGDRETLGTVLIICGEIAILSCYNHKLQVSQQEEQTLHSWHNMSAVMLIGPHQITTPALRQAMAHKVPVFFTNRFGELEGSSHGNGPAQGGALWLLQANHCQNFDFALATSKELVNARINGIQRLISRRNSDWEGLTQLNRIKQKVCNSASIDQLRGYEGQAAKLLWAFFNEYLDRSWLFTGRNRRPPKDPVNAMLSMGYTFLSNLLCSAINVAGLFPWQGIYHQPHGKHPALASDLLEPFRVVVERTVLTLINKNQIKVTDFKITETGCEMSKQARHCVLNALLVDLTQTRHDNRLIDQLFSQPLALNAAFRHQSKFRAWRPA